MGGGAGSELALCSAGGQCGLEETHLAQLPPLCPDPHRRDGHCVWVISRSCCRRGQLHPLEGGQTLRVSVGRHQLVVPVLLHVGAGDIPGQIPSCVPPLHLQPANDSQQLPGERHSGVGGGCCDNGTDILPATDAGC